MKFQIWAHGGQHFIQLRVAIYSDNSHPTQDVLTFTKHKAMLICGLLDWHCGYLTGSGEWILNWNNSDGPVVSMSGSHKLAEIIIIMSKIKNRFSVGKYSELKALIPDLELFKETLAPYIAETRLSSGVERKKRR